MFHFNQGSPLTIERLELKEALQLIREEFSNQLTIREIRWLEPDCIPESRQIDCPLLGLKESCRQCLKYGGEALSEISIRYKETRESHILSIKDNGIGLKEKDDHQDISALSSEENI